LLHCMSRLVALSGHARRGDRCPLSGAKRAWLKDSVMSAYDPSGQKWRIANREKASVFTMHTARCRRRRRWENVKRTRRRICRVVGQRLRVAGVLAIDTGASYLVEIEAGG